MEVTDTVHELPAKRRAFPRQERLRRLATLGRRVPARPCTRDEYNAGRHPQEPRAHRTPARRRAVLRKRVLTATWTTPTCPLRPPVPYIQPVFDRIMLEIMPRLHARAAASVERADALPPRTRAQRGRARGARQGQSVQEHRLRGNLASAPLSTSDYSCISTSWPRRLTDELRDQRVSVCRLPSLRVDKFVQDTLVPDPAGQKEQPDLRPRGRHPAPAGRDQQGRHRGRPGQHPAPTPLPTAGTPSSSTS